MQVLAGGAHPYDLEIMCGGTLARFSDEGHHVAMCNVSNGDCGSFESTSEELVTIRASEASAAAAVINATHKSLGMGDGQIRSSGPAVQEQLIDLIRAVQPDIIITHSSGDYMVDHNEVSQLVFDCSFLASLPLLKTTVTGYAKVTPLYYMETETGVGFHPQEYVDITGTFALRVGALGRCTASRRLHQ
jgi:LmbE family N-acetylglucosaminyl deacetylase